MRELIVGIGGRLIDILFIISCVAVVISGIVMWYNLGGFYGFFACVFSILFGLCFVVISFLLIYVIIDIRDKLTIIVNSKQKQNF